MFDEFPPPRVAKLNYFLASLASLPGGAGENYLEKIRKKSAPPAHEAETDGSLVTPRSAGAESWSGRDAFVPLSANDDGSFTFTAHESIPFTPDGRWEEVELLVMGLLVADSRDVTGKLMRSSADPYPDAWEAQVSQAVDLKRCGQFLASAKIYDELSRTAGVLYTGIITALYKPVAASGALLSGKLLLIYGGAIFRNDPKAVAVAAGGQSTFEDHRSRLTAATRSQPELEAYLRDICGNVNYRLPRDFATAVGDFTQHPDEMKKRYAEEMKKRFAETERLEQSSGGRCYIATAVYGNYDAPAVRTLRRFRDEKLAESSAGRAFIRFYYATSPSIAKRLEGATPLNRAVRRVLDFGVKKLGARGYSGAER